MVKVGGGGAGGYAMSGVSGGWCLEVVEGGVGSVGGGSCGGGDGGDDVWRMCWMRGGGRNCGGITKAGTDVSVGSR